MEFKTLKDMCNYIEKDTELSVIKKGSFPTDTVNWIFSDEGKKVLNSNGYQSREQITKKIDLIYKEMGDSDVVTEGIKKFYTLLINIIKNS